LPGDQEEVRCLAFTPDGSRLAVGGSDRVIHIWDPQKSELVAGQGARSGHPIDLSPAGILVSTCCGSELQAWDVKSGQARPPAGLVAKPLAVACSPDGRWIAATSANPDSRLHIYDVKTQTLRPPVEGPRAPMTFAAFSPDSRRLATCCRSDGTAWLWNPEDGEPMLIIPEAAEGCTVEAVAFHPNNSWLACGGVDYLATGGSDGAVTIWDIETRERVTAVVGGALGLAFDPTGQRLAVVTPDATVCLWQIAKLELIQEIRFPEAGAVAAAFSPDGDGRYLAVACDDHTLRLFDTASGRQFRVELDSCPRSLRFSVDGRTVYTGNGNTTCYAVPVAGLFDG